MSKQRIIVTHHGLSNEDIEYKRTIRKKIDEKLHDFQLAYNKCNCNTCRVTVVNQMEDVINAEIFFWTETLEGPINAGENVDLESLDNSLNQLTALHELIDKINELRKELLNS